MNLKLYYARSSGSLAVRILIHELDLPCDFIAVNMKAKKTETGEDFLTINPKGVLPTIVTEDNIVLTENQVIQQYLADTYGPQYNLQHLLPPTTDFKRYRVLEWLNYARVELHNICSLLLNPDIPKELKEQTFKPMLQNKLAYPNTELANKHYLMGDNFTIADCYLFTILVWLKDFKINIADFPNLEKYFLFLKQRPSIEKSLIEKNML